MRSIYPIFSRKMDIPRSLRDDLFGQIANYKLITSFQYSVSEYKLLDNKSRGILIEDSEDGDGMDRDLQKLLLLTMMNVPTMYMIPEIK